MARLLVLRAIGLGDLLTGVPALRALRRALPDHELVLAAPEPQRPLVELTGAVDTFLPTEELAPIAWSGAPPEIAVELHGNGPATKALLQALSPGRLVTFGGPDADGRHVAGPAWDTDEHERERWCRLVSWAFDCPADPDDVVLARPAQPPAVARAVVVHPGAAYPSRRWPAERFAVVARWLADQGHDVVITGSRDEVDLAEEVRRRADLPREAVLAGRTDLASLAALVADSRLVVSGDTGTAHLASAYRTPSVLLFGPTPPRRWGPPRNGPHTVLWHGEDGYVGKPHATTPDPVLLSIGVREVVSAAEERLRAGSPPSSAQSA